ncbi:hypothetical protein [Mucilaginibacter sp.]|uniref:hypothetical protein n=1 Tax=Mucilaginibacter sp. TaxID=1882438 RepID=UPI003266AB19
MIRTPLIKLIAFLAVVTSFAACSKKINGGGCPTGQMCTMQFVTLSVNFVDKAGKAVTVKDVKVVNQRNNTAILAEGMSSMVNQAGRYVFVTDANKKQLSTDGDDLKITATNAVTNKTVSAIIKISGGCNCHVSKVSGSDDIVFE